MPSIERLVVEYRAAGGQVNDGLDDLDPFPTAVKNERFYTWAGSIEFGSIYNQILAGDRLILYETIGTCYSEFIRIAQSMS